jgi:flagellar hook-associated protein FlgK
MKVNFYLDTRPNSKGDHPIIVAFSHNGKRMLTTTGFSINPQKWDRIKQEVRQGCSNADGWKWNKINAHLATIRATLLDSASKMDVITIEELKRIFAKEFRNNGKPDKEDMTVSEYIAKFRDEVKIENQWTHSTYQKFITLENHLSEFRDPVHFNDIDEDFLNGFITFLRDDKKHRNSTIGMCLFLWQRSNQADSVVSSVSR